MEERRKEDTKIDVLSERLKGFMEVTNNQLKDISCKLDLFNEVVGKLPCEARTERTDAMGRDIGWLQKIAWTLCIVGIPSLLGLAVAWGSMRSDIEHMQKKAVTCESSGSGMRK